MPKPTRVLFVSGEVKPFANVSEIASLTRYLPELLFASGGYEMRIIMPRYGTISERRNRLHEVIRLSGSTIEVGEPKKQPLRVKVAHIPGLRLQVYFMDNVRYFKRKGLHQDREGKLFTDNSARALFFARAVMQTVRNLNWKPDIIHAIGWISGFLPMLITTEFKGDPLLDQTRVVYTPDGVDPQARLSDDLIESMGVDAGAGAAGRTPAEVGVRFADAVAYPPSFENGRADAVQFSEMHDDMVREAMELYATALGHRQAA